MSILTGKISVFGNGYGFTDSSGTGRTGIGLPDGTPGIAVANASTEGGYWLLKTHDVNNKPVIKLVRQTDYGPAGWTGRKFDFSAGLANQLGFTQGNFPTGATASGIWLGKNAQEVSSNLSQALIQLGAKDLNGIPIGNFTKAQAQAMIDQANAGQDVGAGIRPGAGSPAGVAQGALQQAAAIAGFLGSLMDPKHLLRIVFVILGVIGLALGLVFLIKESKTGNANPV